MTPPVTPQSPLRQPTPQDLARAFEQLRESLGKWFQGIKPVLATVAQFLDSPEGQAAIRRVQQQRASGFMGACHCFCGAVHRDAMGICDGEAVAKVHIDSPAIGEVDVPVCSPCLAAR